MKDPDDIRSVLDSLRRLVRELRLFSRRAETVVGLSAAQLFVLERLRRHEALSVNTLADLTLTHQSTVSVVVHKLEERGFLICAPSRDDRRRKQVSITPAGRKALRRAPDSVQDRLIRAAGRMSPKERGELAARLRQWIQLLGLDDSRPHLFFEPEKAPRAGQARARAKHKETR